MADKMGIEIESAMFRKWLRRFQRDARKNVPRNTLRAVGLEAARRFILRTPVDTGRARGGWTAIFDLMGTPMVVGGTSTAAAEGRSQSDVKESYQGREQYIEIINGVAYIIYLEYGHSQQAPNGMVRVTLREITQENLMGQVALKELRDAVDRTNRGA